MEHTAIIRRRCLVPGCGCSGYVMDMEVYAGDENQDFLESDKEEVKSFCSRCGHSDEEHEMAPSAG